VQLLYGVIERTTQVRYILAVDSEPAVENIVDLTAGGLPATVCDWGEAAVLQAAEKTASIMLHFVDVNCPDRLIKEYAKTVVCQMFHTDTMWTVAVDDVEKWLNEKTIQ
jgi:hypothetical protein